MRLDGETERLEGLLEPDFLDGETPRAALVLTTGDLAFDGEDGETDRLDGLLDFDAARLEGEVERPRLDGLMERAFALILGAALRANLALWRGNGACDLTWEE